MRAGVTWEDERMPEETTKAQPGLIQLVSELIEAHSDTMLLAEELRGGRRDWDAHYAYLRDLRRIGRDALARLGGAAGAKPTAA